MAKEPGQEKPGAPLSHFDEKGQAHMVDVSHKPESQRRASAEAVLSMNEEAFAALKSGGAKKGDILGTARIAGIMGAKSTPALIPLCHPLPLSHASIEFELDDAAGELSITANVMTSANTGVEMEALMAASIAALTVYDMLKSVDKSIIIKSTRLIHKSGGKSGEYRAS